MHGVESHISWLNQPTVSTTRHEHEGHGPLRAWTAKADLSNQYLMSLMYVCDIASDLT